MVGRLDGWMDGWNDVGMVGGCLASNSTPNTPSASHPASRALNMAGGGGGGDRASNACPRFAPTIQRRRLL